ncbi:nucleotidyltransferase domain-containing protein [Candidatus Poribacteria bacterium]|nr:nucleotidyltransferase domain-containing protein [Candidatus Poribacteria bacterium]
MAAAWSRRRGNDEPCWRCPVRPARGAAVKESEDPMHSPTPVTDDLDALRERLWTTARTFAATLENRPNVVGLILYGSLAHGGLTPFSDVDIAAVMDGALPEHFAEHRVVGGIKADLIFVERESLLDLLVHVPKHFYEPERTWTFEYVLDSLVRAGPEVALYDPTGLIERVQTELQRLTSFRRLVLPSAQWWFRQAETNPLTEAKAHLQAGEAGVARGKACHAAGDFCRAFAWVNGEKEFRVAAERLGLSEAIDLWVEIERLRPFDRDAAGELWAATGALWRFTLERAYNSVLDALRQVGVQDPEAQELTGSDALFWPGNRIHELGRVAAEMKTSLDWCRYDIDHGETRDGIERLWACETAASIRERWEGIRDTLGNLDHDVSGIVDPMLADAEFARLSERMDRARDAIRPPFATPSDAARTVGLATRLSELLRSVIFADE